jgi:hypothetical protein
VTHPAAIASTSRAAGAQRRLWRFFAMDGPQDQPAGVIRFAPSLTGVTGTSWWPPLLPVHGGDPADDVHPFGHVTEHRVSAPPRPGSKCVVDEVHEELRRRTVRSLVRAIESVPALEGRSWLRSDRRVAFAACRGQPAALITKRDDAVKTVPSKCSRIDVVENSAPIWARP